MSKFDPMGRAKQVAEQATQAALGMKDHAASKAAELRETTATKAGEAAELAAGVRDQAFAKVGGLKDMVVGKMADLKEATLSGIKGMVDDFNQYVPVLREAGYTLQSVGIELGLAPKLIATLDSAPDVSAERVEAVIAEHHEAKVAVALLRSLLAAYRVQSSIRIAGMTPRTVVLEIGVTPAVIVRFS